MLNIARYSNYSCDLICLLLGDVVEWPTIILLIGDIDMGVGCKFSGYIVRAV